jgi:general L-amino acid transport system substrate-binding protein
MASGIRGTFLPVAVVAALAGGAFLHGPAEAGVLDEVQARQTLNCGVDPGLPGFASSDGGRNWQGFEVDYCRAIAAAVLGDADAVTFVPITARQRFNALQSGEIDVLIRDTAWTMARDTTYGLSFTGVTYYNGQGFMVPTSLGVDSGLQLTGAKVCVESGSAAEVAVATFFQAHGMTYTAVPVEDAARQREAYEAGACNVYSGDVVALHAVRLDLARPDDSIVLPDILSKEPYGPLVVHDDPGWFDVVKWVHFALVNAEELGVTSQNVDTMATSANAEIRQLLGADGDFGKGIGLTNEWAANAIRQVGNYGEIFDRNLGAGSRLKIGRGLNELWTKGGLQFAPPIR